MKIDPYATCPCGSNKKVKWCHPNGFVVSGGDLDKDLELGQALIKEFEETRNVYEEKVS